MNVLDAPERMAPLKSGDRVAVYEHHHCRTNDTNGEQVVGGGDDEGSGDGGDDRRRLSDLPFHLLNFHYNHKVKQVMLWQSDVVVQVNKGELQPSQKEAD